MVVQVSTVSIGFSLLSLMLLSGCGGVPRDLMESASKLRTQAESLLNDLESSQCQRCREQFSDGDFDQVKAMMTDTSKLWRELPYNVNYGKLWRYDDPSMDIQRKTQSTVVGEAVIKARLCFTVANFPARKMVPLFSYADRQQGCHSALKARLVESCPNNHIVYLVHKFSPLKVDRDFLQAVAVRKDSATDCTIVAHKSAPNANTNTEFPPHANNVVVRGTVRPSGVQVCSAAGGINTDVCILVNYDIKEQVKSDIADSIARDVLSRWHDKVVDCSTQDTGASPIRSKSLDPVPDKVISELIANEKEHSAVNGWKNVSESSNAKTYYKHWAGTTTYAFKSFYKAAVPSCTLMKIITDYHSRANWDPTFPHVEILQKDGNTHLIHWLLGLPHPFINRDVVLYSTIKRLPSGGFVIVYVNSKDKKAPQAGVVRAVAYPSAIFIHPDRQDPERSSLMSYNMHMDLGKGIRPGQYQNLLQGRAKWLQLLEMYYNEQDNAKALGDIHSSYGVSC
jgi:hypothetical protein